METPRGPRGSSYNRPPAAVARVHEKFTPSSEWKQGKESDILLIFLPDVLKQSVVVITETGETGNILTVIGERPVVGNKLSRFQEVFEIPKNCTIEAIRTKYEGEILTITFPRIADTATSTTTTTTTTMTTTNEKPKTSQPSPTLPPSQKQDKKGPTSQITEAAIPRKPALPTPLLKEPTSQTTKADIPSTPALPGTELKELARSRFQTPSPPKPTNVSNFTSNIDADLPKEPRKFIESSRPPLVDDKTPFLPTLGTGKGTIREEVSKAKDDVKNEKTEKQKESETYQSGSEKRSGIEKVENVQTKGKKHNENDEKVINKIVEKTDEVDFNLVMKSLGRRLTEEKESVLNMGAAITVIVGLGAYVYHSFSSAKLAKR